MSAVRIAIVDEQLTAQLAERPDALEGVDVIWVGTDIAKFRAEAPALTPDAIALDLGALGYDAAAQLESLLDATGAQLVLVLYTFARRELLVDLARTQAKPLRAPLSLDSQRAILSGLMVRKLLAGDGTAKDRRSAPPAPSAAVDEPSPVVVSPRFSRAQLGRLKEIDSAIECECPANLADVLTQLVSFEQYSAGCSSRNEKDRQIHQMLYEQTRRARKIMEDALGRLIEHERIEI